MPHSNDLVFLEKEFWGYIVPHQRSTPSLRAAVRIIYFTLRLNFTRCRMHAVQTRYSDFSLPSIKKVNYC